MWQVDIERQNVDVMKDYRYGYDYTGDKNGGSVVAKPKEVRVTSPTGGQKGTKPERLDLVPAVPLLGWSRVLAYGADKYDEHNYRKGYKWSLSFAALMRHLWAFWNGEDTDPESGLPHLDHAMFHVGALRTFMEEHPDYDDRYTTNTEEINGQ